VSQHAIDLLPESIRARCQAGVRTGQSIAAAAIVVAVVVVLTTHARLSLNRARTEFRLAEDRANLVLVAEGRAAELRVEFDELNRHVKDYARIAHPLEISRVVATIVNQLPGSITLDSLEFDAAPHRVAPSPRGKSVPAGAQEMPRRLSGEIGGFAATDHHIAELVTRLEQTSPFREVSLDYSRSRAVRDRAAREFRLSFQIDLERQYVDESAAPAPPLGAATATEGLSHAPR